MSKFFLRLGVFLLNPVCYPIFPVTSVESKQLFSFLKDCTFPRFRSSASSFWLSDVVPGDRQPLVLHFLLLQQRTVSLCPLCQRDCRDQNLGFVSPPLNIWTLKPPCDTLYPILNPSLTIRWTVIFPMLSRLLEPKPPISMNRDSRSTLSG